jgi:hypothetical protein
MLPSTAFAAPPEELGPEAPVEGPAPEPVYAEPVYYEPAPAPVYQPPPPQPIPPPSHNRNRGLGLTIAGFSVFGFSYLISAVSATIMIDTGASELGRPLLIPAIGPFVAASRAGTAVGAFGLGFVGVIQLAGLGMGVGGAVMLGNSRRQAQLSATSGGLQVRF